MSLKKIMSTLLILLIIAAAAVVVYMQQPKFGRAPSSKRLERIERSPNYRNGKFQNPELTPQITSDKGRVWVMLDFLFEKRPGNRPSKPLPAVKTDLKTLDQKEDLFVWFGHSSYYLQLAGKRMLVDPVFGDAAPVGFLNRPFEGTDIYKADDMPAVDYLVITHDHWDHLDYETVCSLKDRVGQAICPLGVGEYLEMWGYRPEQIIEMDWWEQTTLADSIRIHCLPTRHFSGRTLRANGTLWGAFLIETPERTILLGGDGGYGSHIAQIARRFPHIDLAVLENGQYNTSWKYIHMLPEDLAQALRELKPQAAFLGHNSKYALAKHTWDEPLETAAALCADSVPVLMPQIGEAVRIPSAACPQTKWWTR